MIDNKKLEAFHERLKRFRNSRNLSIANIATKTGVPTSTYREWEYGRSITGGEPFVKLANAFDVSVYELLTGEKPNIDELLQDISTAIEHLDKLRAKLHALF